MTMFVNGSVGLPVTIHAANDLRNTNQIYFGRRSRAPVPVANEQRTADNSNDAFEFQTRWWPRSGMIIGGWGYEGDLWQNKAPRWISPWTASGANGRLGFVGITRDENGSPLGGCTVRLYRTSTEELVAKVTSDANGHYFATTPYSDEHFLVIHNAAGTLGGATKTTLLPA